MTDIHISGVHNYKISDRLRGTVEEKLGSLSRFNIELTKIVVTIGEAENKCYRVDVDMHLSHEKDVVAHVVAPTVYAAIDGATDKCAAQLRKIHDKQSRRSDRQALKMP